MADIPFQIGGNTSLPCPDFSKSDFSELGDIEYSYLDGSPVYLGKPTVTLVWPNITNADAAAIRVIYDTFVTGYNPVASNGVPISLTVPDYAGGGLRTTTAYMLEPMGTAGGDITRDFKVTFTNLHEAAFQDAINDPGTNLWESWDVEIGTANYSAIGWQF